MRRVYLGPFHHWREQVSLLPRPAVPLTMTAPKNCGPARFRFNVLSTYMPIARRTEPAGPISVTTSMHASVMQHGKTMPVDTIGKERWLNADCGGAKDIEIMP